MFVISKDFSVYFLLGALTRLVPIIAIPIFVRHLTLNDYGYVDNALVIVTIAYAIIGMSASSFLASNFKEKKNLKKNINSVFQVTTVNFIFAFFVVLSFGEFYIFSQFEMSLILFLAYLNNIIYIISSIYRLKRNAKISASIEFIRTLLGFIIGYIILFLSNDWFSRIEGMIFANIIILILILIDQRRRIYDVMKVDFMAIKKTYSFVVPLVFHGLGALVMNTGDRLMITSMIGLEQTTLYSSVYNYCLVILLFSESFLRSKSPDIYAKKFTKNGIKILLQKYLTYGLILSVLIWIALRMSLPIIFGNWIREGLNLLPYILLGIYCFTIFQFINYFIILRKRTQILMIFTLATCCVNISLNFLLIPSFGLLGASFATMISYMALMVLCIYWFRRNLESCVKMENER